MRHAYFTGIMGEQEGGRRVGDYTKLIVDATVKIDRKELEAKLSGILRF